MIKFFFTFIYFLIAIVFSAQNNPDIITIVIHGGAGSFTKENFTQDKENAYKTVLTDALNNGYDVLFNGGTSENAIITAITILEDSPLFNAGKGAVLTNKGQAELDASIMLGNDLNAGAVAGVTLVKNPIKAAQAVMNRSEHVLLSGNGANEFSKSIGLDIVPASYFITESRKRSLKKVKSINKTQGYYKDNEEKDDIYKYGTVGAIALDQYGNLAAGTSTGGMTNKKHGRIGDSPIIGAGTYANNETCAISCTGHGEYFIRLSLAHDISAMMEYNKIGIQKAAYITIHKKLTDLNGTGGVIGLDKKGNFVMEFNTKGMFRGYKNKNESAQVFMYNDK